jgi:hypothetical protein
MAGLQPSQNREEEPQTYKEKLDQVAEEKRKALHRKQPNPIVEKSKSSPAPANNIHTGLTWNGFSVTEYVPAASKIIGSSTPEPAVAKSEDIPGPPERPHHDDKIEEFVRDQHRSKSGD